MSTHYDTKYWTYFYKPKSRTELTLKFGKNKSKHPHDRTLNFEGSFHKRPAFGTYLEREENKLTLSLQLIFFSLYITYSGLKEYIIHGKDTWRYSLTIHDWTVWWNLGCEPHSWSSTDGWRNTNFDIVKFFVGKMEHDQINHEDKLEVIKLPEGSYQAKMDFADFVRWRSRIPKFIWKGTVRRVNLEITPEIPYPGKNDPVSGYSSVSFPASSVTEVLDTVYKYIKKKRRDDLSYYANDNRKMVDDYIYTINGLDINIGRVPVEKRKGEWHPVGTSTSRISDETFRKLSKQKEKFTTEESHFVNKYMGRVNSLDFIKDYSQEDIQKDMLEYFKTRNMNISCGEGSASTAVPAGAK